MVSVPAWPLPAPSDQRLPAVPGAAPGIDVAPNARVPWALDSGGFTELSPHGHWRLTADEYGGWWCGCWRTGLAARLRRPPGLDVRALDPSQDRPVGPGPSGAHVLENLLYLREHFYFVPWLSVLQGWTVEDYLAHADAYDGPAST